MKSQHIPPSITPENKYHPSSPQPETKISKKRKIIVQQATNNLGKPYKWGGQSPITGFDCSGLVIYTHQQAGLNLPRTAKKQFYKGRSILKKNLLPADLVFFSNPRESKTYHVGIYIGNGQFIHAPGKGRGVISVNMDNPYFKKHFIGSKSYL